MHYSYYILYNIDKLVNINESRRDSMNRTRIKKEDAQDHPMTEEIKTFPLKLPFSLWHEAKQIVAAQLPITTLHNYIIEAIREKNERAKEK